MSTNVQLMLKIETKVKLNIINEDGSALYSEDQKDDKEIHYMYVESVTDTYEVGFGALKQALHQFFFKKEAADKMIERMNEWTVIDFDNCLEGNPHT